MSTSIFRSGPQSPRLLRLILVATVIFGATFLNAGPAMAGIMGDVSVTYTTQSSTVAGGTSEYLTIKFRPQVALSGLAGDTITIESPAGGKLPATANGYQLIIGLSGYAVPSTVISNDRRTATISLTQFGTSLAAAAGSLVSVTTMGTVNPTLAGDYSWRAWSTRDSAGTSDSVSITAGPATALTAVAGSTRGAIGTTLATPFKVQTTDVYGNSTPVEGVPVTFSAPATGASGTFPAGLTAIAETDLLGQASSPAFTLGNVSGAAVVTATAAGWNPVTFNLYSVPGTPITAELSADTNLLERQGDDPVTMTANLRDQHGNPITPDELDPEDFPQLTSSSSNGIDSLGYHPEGWRWWVYPDDEIADIDLTVTGSGLSKTVTISQAAAPEIGSVSIPSPPRTDSATIVAAVQPNNAPTSYRVKYGVNSVNEFTSAVATVTGIGQRMVAIELTGLAPRTRYVYRVLAGNDLGQDSSNIFAFTTGSLPTVPDTGGGDSAGNGKVPDANGADGVAKVTSPKFGPRKFRIRSGKSGGTTLRFRLNSAVRVKVSFERKVRRQGKTRWLRSGKLSIAGAKGLNRVRFSGKIGRKALTPGAYRVTLTPAGGKPAKTQLRIQPAT